MSTAARTSASLFRRAVGTWPEATMRGPLISPLSTFFFNSRMPSLSSPPDWTVVNPASSNSRIRSAALSFMNLATASGPRPWIRCRWSSIKPAITVMPAALIRLAPLGMAAAPSATDAIRPSLTMIEPFSITWPLPTMMRALVIARSCAATTLDEAAPASSELVSTAVCQFNLVHLVIDAINPVSREAPSGKIFPAHSQATGAKFSKRI